MRQAHFPAAHKFLRGDTRSSTVALPLLLAACALLAASGCGEGGGVGDGAVVAAYVVAPLCAEAVEELERQGGRAGEVRVRVVCLPAGGADGRLDLARIGANARRATEDSSSIAYIATPTRANRYSRPILEEANIPQLTNSSGERAIANLLQSIRQAPAGAHPRRTVEDELR